MKLSYLRLVKVVSEERTLTKACERLFLSQPALSHQLKELEAYCEAPIFKRIGKKMVLSELGERVLQTAHVVLSEINELENEIQWVKESNKIKLTIGSSCYTGYFWLPSVIKEFYYHYPESELIMAHEATDDPITYVLQGKVDVAIVNKKVKNPNLAYTEAFRDQLQAIVSHDHKWAQRKLIDPEEFVDQNVIVYPKPITAFQDLLKIKKVKPMKEIQMQLTEARVEMVKANLGVTVMANWAIRPYIERNEVVPVQITKKGLVRTLYVVYLKNSNEFKYIKDLIELIKAKMSAL